MFEDVFGFEDEVLFDEMVEVCCVDDDEVEEVGGCGVGVVVVEVDDEFGWEFGVVWEGKDVGLGLGFFLGLVGED